VDTQTYALSAGSVVVLVLVAVWTDLRSRRIPNALTLGGAVLGLLLHVWAGGSQGVGGAAMGWSLGLLLLLPGYLLRFTSAGDVKLLAAVGAFLGPQAVLAAGAASIAAGAMVGIPIVALLGGLRGLKSPWNRYGVMLRCLVTTGRVAYVRPGADEAMGQRFPFSVAIALGTLFAVGWISLSGQV
jgi:prepilin peptidase CpaA